MATSRHSADELDWDEGLGELIDVVTPIVDGVPSFELVVGDEAMFGPGGEVSVNITMPDARLQELHGSLIQDGMRFVQPAFLHEGFQAHITHFSTGRPVAGEHVRLRQVVLAELTGDRAIVRANWSLA